jgi:hypothetical protein
MLIDPIWFFVSFAAVIGLVGGTMWWISAFGKHDKK